jgi:hypothetical protein
MLGLIRSSFRKFCMMAKLEAPGASIMGGGARAE